MNIKISVVVPVYNVEKYLEQCLDSILNQTLKEIEIICVNDGSTDRCVDILDDYAKKDDRIIVVHKPNTGYGNTMNIGFDMAKGAYIGIVESDDFIAPTMYETLYKSAIAHQLDFAKCNRYSLYDNQDGTMHTAAEPLLLPPDNYDTVLNFKEMPLSKRIQYEEFKWIWCGIYRSEFIRENQIRFHETPGASYQDTSFHFLTMMLSERALLLQEPLHYYRRNNLNSSANSDALITVLFKEYEFIKKCLEQRGVMTDDLIQFIDYCCLNNCALQFPRLGIVYVKSFVDLIRNYMVEQNALPCSDLMHHIYHNPEFIVEKTIAEKKIQKETLAKYLPKLEQAKRIVIYGAGICGDYMYSTLGMLGFLYKVECFAVTGPTKSGDLFFDIPLKSIGDVKNEDCLLIVAAKYTNLLEMQETAKKLEFHEVLTMLDFL